LWISLEARLRYRKILDRYSERLQKEWEQLSPHLPAQAARTLDIGCGIGGIDAFLYEHYSSAQSVSIFLLDRNDTERSIYYGMHDDAAAYNSLAASKSYLVQRGVPKEAIHMMDAGRDALPQDISFDVILSMLSWGYHYPIQTYLEYVIGHLARNGTLIVDCRKGTDGLKTLREHFEISVIYEDSKDIRVSGQWRNTATQASIAEKETSRSAEDL
jgi:SAM-dependent methyltransferase